MESEILLSTPVNHYMIEQILDLHIHSRYSRACSKDLVLPNIAKTCEIRGIQIAVTGDFTHPKWFEHMTEWLVPENEGMYKLRDGSSPTRFMIGTEVASIKKHGAATRRVHHLLFAPTLEVAAKFNKELEDRGFNIRADGRPILGLTSKQILELMLEADPRMVMIPAHAWTPWFGIFGSRGGYNTMEECFEELTPHIFAIETGLSSDPLMNWRWSALDTITLISNSDAHSPQKLGREANVMQFSNERDITYDEIMRILREGDKEKFLYTIEFYPEEGKYHLDGHRLCKFFCEPEETKRRGGMCPKCKKPLVVGVMHRVNDLADRSRDAARHGRKIPYKSLVPLPEILSDTLGCGVQSKRVKEAYDALIKNVGNEFFILLHADCAAIARASSPQIAEAVKRVRAGNIVIEPGYDGVFGVVKVFGEGEGRGQPRQTSLTLE